MSMKTVLMVILLFMVVVLSGCENKVELEVGQVWAEKSDDGDPFKEWGGVTRKILAIQKGYVQYEYWYGDHEQRKDTGSVKATIFRRLGNLVADSEPAPYPFSGVPIEEPKDSIVIDAATGTARYAEAPVIEFGNEFTSDLIIVNQEQIDNGWSAPSNDVGVSYSDIVVDEPTVAEPPVWGKGELPADHQDFFGDGNDSRLNYVQNRVLDKHGEILKILAIRVLALEAVDPNAIPVETRLDRLEASLIREAQAFRGAEPIEDMVRWDHKPTIPSYGSEECWMFTEGRWSRIMSRNKMLSDSEIEKLMEPVE